MTNIVIAFVSGLVLFFGGFFVGNRTTSVHDEQLPAKYQTTYNVQDVKNKTEVAVTSQQGQTTIMVTVSGQTNAKFYNWQVNSHTNVSFSRIIMTNKVAKSNAEKLIKSLNLPKIPYLP